MAIEGAGAQHQPWEALPIRPGQLGLQLAKSQDQLDSREALKLINQFAQGGGDLVSRAGLTELVRGPNSGLLHSIHRRWNPLLYGSGFNPFARFWGIGADLYKGETGGLTKIDTGYSGDPLCFTDYRPEATNDAFVIVSDRSRMRQIQPGGADMPLGLTRAARPAVAVQAQLKNTIAAFDSSDGSQAANWTATAGQDRSSTPVTTATGTATDIVGKSGNAIEFATFPGAATKGYYNLFGISRSLNLGWIVDGVRAASNDDIIHVWVRMDRPSKIEEVRIYLVVSDGFQPNVVPGTSETNNTDAYVQTFQPSGFTGFTELQETQAAAAARRQEHLDIFANKDQGVLDEDGNPDLRDSWADRRQAETNQAATEAVAGRGVWTEFGVIGVPLRRSDFVRLGNDLTKNWGTVQGLIVVIQTVDNSEVKVAFDDFYQTGGSGVDSATPGTQPYDYRITDVDRRTGVESNGSLEFDEDAFVDSLRQLVHVTPVPKGDATNYFQRLYRRGGTVVDNWYFVDENDSDGEVLVDDFSDDTVLGTGQTVPLNHDPPVPSVDNFGTEIVGQTVPIIFGPVNGLFFALGDPNRPGVLYWSVRDNPNYWPPEQIDEVCAPSEELMTGCVHNEQGYVVSRQRLYVVYPDLASDGVVRTTPTPFKHGAVSRKSLASGPLGMAVVSADGIRLTNGGDESYISDAIRPLFQPEVPGQAYQGFYPIDFTVPLAIQIAYHGYDLWFLYKDTQGSYRTLCYSGIYKYWWVPEFGQTVTAIESELGKGDGKNLLFGGAHSGSLRKGWTHEGFTDDGAAFTCRYRSGLLNAGSARLEKLWGDISLEVTAPAGLTLNCTTYLNGEVVANSNQSLALPVVADATKRRRVNFDAFGLVPQQGRNMSLELYYTAPSTGIAKLHCIDPSYQLQPEQTFQRPTAWEKLPGGEGYLTGMMIDCNTYGEDVVLVVESDQDGATNEVTTITINHDGRHKLWYSWDVVKANAVRIRPGGACSPWLLYNAEWLSSEEPPRIARWDSRGENKWDTYYTGLDIECDTFGQEKVIEVYVDEVLVHSESISAAGHRAVHLTFGPGRGHVYRFQATDNNRGLLYGWRWQLAEEPSEQSNWNAPYTVEGTLTDKWIKGVLLDFDTFGEEKTVEVQVDGAVVETLTLTQNGRGVQHVAFTGQYKGRVLRLLPTDANPSRLYMRQYIFDSEPLALTRWETQETDHGIHGRQALIAADVTLRSTAEVTLTITLYNQRGVLINTRVYPISSTGGAKQKRFVPFYADAGWLFKYVFTCASAFTLYREESQVTVQQLAGEAPQAVKPFGNDDLGVPIRGMGNAALSAAAPERA